MGTILKKKNMFTSINYNDSSQRVILNVQSMSSIPLVPSILGAFKSFTVAKEEEEEVKTGKTIEVTENKDKTNQADNKETPDESPTIEKTEEKKKLEDEKKMENEKKGLLS